MPARQLDVIQGTLDMLVLHALADASAHGYAIMEWLRRATGDELRLEDAALYPALHRMEERGMITSEWGLSENNRRAKYYELTAKGRRELRATAETWRRYSAMVGRVLGASGSS